MVKISALPPAGTLADDDETPFVDDSTASTKKFTLLGLKEWLQSITGWITTAMYADESVTNAKLAVGADEPGGAWDDWTPSYTNITLGNGTVVAKYKIVGKTVTVELCVTAGTTTSFANYIAISIPVTAASRYSSTSNIVVGSAAGSDFGVNGYPGMVLLSQSTTQVIIRWVGGASVWSTAFPFVEGSGDTVSASFTYEAA